MSKEKETRPFKEVMEEHYAIHGRVVPARYEEKLIRKREDGTRVYIFQMVEEEYTIHPDGTKTYRGRNGGRNWIIPDMPKRKPKRRDIHTIIDKEIFKAMKELKHAKKRLVIAAVRTALQQKEDIAEYLPKNVGITISRRIAHLVTMNNIEYVKETKTRTVLSEGKYKYVGR
jgi:hypothetical protein